MDGRVKRLTCSGEILLSHARLILELNDDIWSLMNGSKQADIIRIGAPDDYVETLLPKVLDQFSAPNPKTQIDIVCEPSENLPKRIQANNIDLAVVTGQPGDRLSETLRREPFVWVTSPHHRLSKSAPLCLALFQPGCMARSIALQACKESSFRYRITYCSPSMAGPLPFVRSEGAIAVLARSAVPPDLRILGEEDGFPTLPSIDIALMQGAARQNNKSV